MQGYEAMGASAIFLEDQLAPKRCGHMVGKRVVPAETHVAKIRAAAAARHSPETFIIARTDARAPLGLDEALRRAELYVKAGADGVYVEAVESIEELERPRGAPRRPAGDDHPRRRRPDALDGPEGPQGARLLDGALSDDRHLPRDPRHPEGVEDLKAGRPMAADDAVTFEEYEEHATAAAVGRCRERL